MTRQNRVALVTGGSRGIGAAIVRRLASDGASVAFTYSSSEKQALELVSEVEEARGIAFAIKADSAIPEAVRGAVARAVARFGGLDVLVNNAGILLQGTVDDFDLADFDRMVAINIKAVFVATQAAIPHLREGARIITTGSIAAERAGFPDASVYSMTKGAVAALTRGLARDLGPRGITVNAFQPGLTETDMNASPGPRYVKAFDRARSHRQRPRDRKLGSLLGRSRIQLCDRRMSQCRRRVPRLVSASPDAHVNARMAARTRA
jgi:3-oxoacyl-[acyl-carrier protein] reductase